MGKFLLALGSLLFIIFVVVAVFFLVHFVVTELFFDKIKDEFEKQKEGKEIIKGREIKIDGWEDLLNEPQGKG